MIKIKNNIELKELEKFGFVKNDNSSYSYIREIDGNIVYKVIVTKNYRYLQIYTGNMFIIASSLQTLIYDLIKADIIEKI